MKLWCRVHFTIEDISVSQAEELLYDSDQLAPPEDRCWLTLVESDRSHAAAYGVGRRILAQRATRRLLKRQREEAAAAAAAHNADRERETLGHRTEGRDYDRDHPRPPRASEFREEAS